MSAQSEPSSPIVDSGAFPASPPPLLSIHDFMSDTLNDPEVTRNYSSRKSPAYTGSSGTGGDGGSSAASSPRRVAKPHRGSTPRGIGSAALFVPESANSVQAQQLSLKLATLPGAMPPSWFHEMKGPARFEQQVYHSLGRREVPYWLSYSQASMNWDALVESSLFLTTGAGSAAFLPFPTMPGLPSTRTPPSSVLDLGSGLSALWCVQMASHPGWEATQFKALDVGPSRMPSDLPESLDERLAYVQHNFLRPLPFPNASFDYVRMAYVGLGLPESKVADLLAEVARVLIPGGLIEILEMDLSVLRERPAVPPITPPHSISSFSNQQDEDPLLVIDECFETVLQARHINPRLLRELPDALASKFDDVLFSGTLHIDMPASPPRNSTIPSATLPSIDVSPYRPFDLRKRRLSQSSTMSRVFLAAYAERMAGCSEMLASEGAKKRRDHSRKVGPSATAPWLDNLRLERELPERLEAWCDDLKERAGLARLLEDRLDWSCVVDQEMEGSLETMLPVFDVRLAEYATLECAEEELDDHIEFRKAQVVVAKRDAEASLKAVRRRLGRDDERDFGFQSSLGSMEFASFIGTAR